MTILTSVTEIEDRIVDTIRDIQRPVVDYVLDDRPGCS